MRACRVLVVLFLASAGGVVWASEAAGRPYSSHSQLYTCCTAPATQEAMFREAKAGGAEFIRVDVAMEAVAPEFGPPGRSRDWRGLDRVADLSARHGIRVLAVLQGTPRQWADCADVPWWQRRLCPPAESALWAALAGEIAARYAGRIDHFQIWNEPDGQWAFGGTAEDYGRILASAFTAIGERAPGATIVLGGLMDAGSDGRTWLSRALDVDGGAAARSFHVAAFHYRGAIGGIVPTVHDWAAYLAARGHPVPIWVTEHAYPGAPEWQTEPGFTGGEGDQARYFWTSLPTFVSAGAAQVFVTLHDGGGGRYDSEGILAGHARPGESFRRKPAWYAVFHAPLGLAEAALEAPPEAVTAVRPCAMRQVGGRGRDRLTGTLTGDRLVGRVGADVLLGRGGDDCLSGGRGRDRLNGGRGRDRMSGGPGADTIRSADGIPEIVRCGRGVDRVYADVSDRLRGCERVRRRFSASG